MSDEHFGCEKHCLWRHDCPSCNPPSDLQDAINMARYGDPVKAIEAFNRGAQAAKDDRPLLPGDYTFTTPAGIPVKVVIVDDPD